MNTQASDRRVVVRVYGLLFNPNKEVLITDEERNGWKFSKFPGGGLEWGEGLVDALKREFLEETNLHLADIQHFYTTDFFQQSAFNTNDQILSVYYLTTALGVLPGSLPPPITEHSGTLSFRWIPLHKLTPELFTFPIDKYVVGLLKNTELALKFLTVFVASLSFFFS